jgi:hypothetical protein
MPTDSIFNFDGKPGDLVAIHYADVMHTDMGILLRQSGDIWTVLDTSGSARRIQQDALQVVMEVIAKSS